jgi:hypothetical protein
MLMECVRCEAMALLFNRRHNVVACMVLLQRLLGV